MISILSDAINNPAPTELSAATAADEIDKLYPAGTPDAEDFLWSLWSLLVSVAKKIPAHDARQQLLVTMIEKLKSKRDDQVQMWGQTTRVWTELPMLGPVMRDSWNCESDAFSPSISSPPLLCRFASEASPAALFSLC